MTLFETEVMRIMRISIFGMGYVGAVSYGCLVRDGHEVLGVDIDKGKLELLEAGTTPIIEEGMEELIRSAAASGRANVTDDAANAIHTTELSFICVGTPSAANGEHDLGALRHVIQTIGAAIKEKLDSHTVVIRSTVAPGTTEKELLPLLEQSSGKTCGEGFELCFQPEFLREGSSIRDYDNPPFTVIGCSHEAGAKKVKEIFDHLESETVTTEIKTAEMLKFCCNVFHALKIGFANEVGRVCRSLDVDAMQVMDLVCMDTQLNISTMYLKPGLPFGGSCLPKDTRAMVKMSHDSGVPSPIIQGIMPSNKDHSEFISRMILKNRTKKIGLLGLSFKSGTDDLRESPLVELVETLIGKGVDIQVYDPEVNLARLVGANKRFIEEVIPHISKILVADLDGMLSWADVIVIGRPDKELVDTVIASATSDQHIVDMVGAIEPRAVASSYEGMLW
jgi:GDP-mannose 6-dehydrogenase